MNDNCDLLWCSLRSSLSYSLWCSLRGSLRGSLWSSLGDSLWSKIIDNELQGVDL